jgi:hypothetical protein
MDNKYILFGGYAEFLMIGLGIKLAVAGHLPCLMPFLYIGYNL